MELNMPRTEQELEKARLYTKLYREQHKDSPEWREKKRVSDLISYHKNKEKNKERVLARQRERRNSLKDDPIFLAGKSEDDRKYREKLKATDPLYAEKLAKRFREFRERAPQHFMVVTAKQRAKKYNLPFNITVEDVTVPEYCPALGVKLEVAKGRMKPNSPSLDKIIPELGYVKGNVQVLSLKANLMKNNASKDELIKFAAWINKTYEN